MRTRTLLAAAGLLAALVTAGPARAIRPFVTDDARVVGDRTAQLETWVLVDRLALQQNVLAALGPTGWLELTLGLTHGYVHSGAERGYSITGPIFQAKALILPAVNNARPGLAVAAGFLPPAGHGAFVPPGWGGFGYVAATESLLDEWLLVHANVGLALVDLPAEPGLAGTRSSGVHTQVTAGLGAQGRLVAGLHAISEVFYGDPYDPQKDFPAMQVGFRYIFSERVQMDGTFGTTLRAVSAPDAPPRTEQWGTLGIRLVSPALW